MDIGIMHREGIFDEEFLKRFRIMGIIMDKSLDQKTVLDLNLFVTADRYLKLPELKQRPPFF